MNKKAGKMYVNGGGQPRRGGDEGILGNLLGKNGPETGNHGLTQDS